MFGSNGPLATIYLAAPLAAAETWLVQGVAPAPPSVRPALAAGRVAAWLAAEPVGDAEAVWLVAAVEPTRVVVADWDLARGADVAPRPEDRLALADAYLRSATPLSAYRLGQVRRPQALVQGALAATTLARLAPAETPRLHGAAYARQLHQALRALVGAPGDAPLAALVAAAVGRGRARLVAAYPDPAPVYLYRVDEGEWYFSLASEFNTLTAYPEGNSQRIKE